MPQPILTAAVQKLVVSGVGALVLTDIETDADGNAVRELRVSGVVDADNPQPPLVLTVRLAAASKAAVTLTTPTLSF